MTSKGLSWDVDVSTHDDGPEDPRTRETMSECPKCFPPLKPGDHTTCRDVEPQRDCVLCRGAGLVTKRERDMYLLGRGDT